MELKLSDSLGFILNKTNTKLKNELLQRFKEYDITPEQWAILCCLLEREGITPKELSDLTCKDKPNTKIEEFCPTQKNANIFLIRHSIH